ncbi:MAG TPA: biotin/lipoyl-binding protein, partial [Candidatus Limnocylindrales bacterium]|nr:biotin/lipoyl-binding protein [Candidatus Limnocylindrales bacterium]
MMTTRTGSSSSAAATLERTAGEEAIAVETRQPPTQKLMPSDPSPQPSDRQKPKRWLQAIGVVTVAALAIYVGYRWWSSARNWVTTDNAYVAAHIHTISSRLAGTVQEVLVDENQAVASGSVLARLDSSDFEVKQQQALAQLAQANAHLQRAEAQISQAQAEIAREQAVATRAHQDLQRAESLFQDRTGAISKQEFDQAKSESDAADARLAAARSALASVAALAVAAQAEEKVAQANLRDAELQVSYTEIKAPTAGRIGKKSLETGNRIQPGQALLALVEPDVWVTANFKE